MAEILPIRRKTIFNRSRIQVRAMLNSVERSPCMQKVSARILVQQIPAETDLVR